MTVVRNELLERSKELAKELLTLGHDIKACGWSNVPPDARRRIQHDIVMARNMLKAARQELEGCST